MVQTPQGPTFIPVEAPGVPHTGKGVGTPEEHDSKKNPNKRVQLPWYLYWNGEKGSDGQEKSLAQYEDLVDGWVREFSSKSGLGL